ncbi:MAG TPA: alpha-1,2-fucosyltransferase [Saprospiraceae bacterium]|nr:alpha-1,2-fucosyltransferase [Saprospiraceae bacterium]
MLFLSRPYGQRSNQLFQHIHLDSYCRENGLSYKNYFLYSMKNDYLLQGAETHLSKFGYVFFKLLNDLRIGKYLSYKFHLGGNNAEFRKKIDHNWILYASDFGFRSIETTKKDRALYQKMFTPKHIDVEKFTPFLNRKEDQIILGLHVRRGDYKTWYDGKYFYDDEVYGSVVVKFGSLVQKKLKIIVFTNDDELDTKRYLSLSEEKQVFFSKFNAVEDHYMMSKCDFLIGPPSTFTAWASYMGEVPLMYIESPDRNFTIEDFKICDGETN